MNEEKASNFFQDCARNNFFYKDMFPYSYLSPTFPTPPPQMGLTLLNLSIINVDICQGFPCFHRTIWGLCEETAPHRYLFQARSSLYPTPFLKMAIRCRHQTIWDRSSRICRVSTISLMHHYWLIKAISGCALFQRVVLGSVLKQVLPIKISVYILFSFLSLTSSEYSSFQDVSSLF